MEDQVTVNEANTSENTDTCKFVFKKRNVRKQVSRKRDKDSDGESSDDCTTVIKKDKKIDALNHLRQSTNTKRQKRKEDDDDSSEGESVTVSYKSKKLPIPTGPSDQGATATLETETDFSTDAQAIFEKAQKINEELEGKEDDKIYRGMNNYAQYYKKKDTAAGNASSGMVRKGPIRAPTNLRATVRWDYQPDICKDYKETGFCGFGDSCKFLHDRSDYKLGWQLEREAATADGDDSGDEDDHKYEIDSDEEQLPFKCFICRGTFVDPIMTKCKHYYCEKCALAHYKKSTKCYICNAQTFGVFNPAKDIIKKMEAIEAENANNHDNDDDGDSE